jgi:hypothetical protein
MHEHMDQLMADDMAELRDRAVGRNNDAPFEKLEKPADTFRDETAGGIGLDRKSVV